MRLSLYLFLSSFLCRGRHLSLLEHCFHHQCLDHSFLLGNVANTCTHAPFPRPGASASVLQLCLVFRLPGPTACSSILLSWGWSHPRELVLGDIRDMGSCVLHRLCHLLPSPQGGAESGTSRAPHFPLLWHTPQFWRKCFLLTTILSFHLYPLSCSSFLCS